jgi:hypothetical protein
MLERAETTGLFQKWGGFFAGKNVKVRHLADGGVSLI